MNMSSVTAGVDSSTRYHEYTELVAQYTRLGALAASKNGRERERGLQGDLRYFRNKAIESAELYATSVSEGTSGTAAGSSFEKNYKCGDTPELAMGDAGEDGEGRVQELQLEHGSGVSASGGAPPNTLPPMGTVQVHNALRQHGHSHYDATDGPHRHHCSSRLRRQEQARREALALDVFEMQERLHTLELCPFQPLAETTRQAEDSFLLLSQPHYYPENTQQQKQPCQRCKILEADLHILRRQVYQQRRIEAFAQEYDIRFKRLREALTGSNSSSSSESEPRGRIKELERLVGALLQKLQQQQQQQQQQSR